MKMKMIEVSDPILPHSLIPLSPTNTSLQSHTKNPHLHPQQQIRCWSNQGDDVVRRSYDVGQKLTHDFCDTEFPRETIYTCRFWWNGRVKDFRIYRPFFDYHYIGNTIYFAVRDDGFYFSDSYPPSKLEKKIGW